jgi:hypothetical protein
MKSKIIVFSVFISASLLVETACARSDSLLEFVHTTFIAYSGAPIRPLAITTSLNNSFVITGSAGNNAWAAKIGGNGNVLWQYVTNTNNGNDVGRKDKFVGAVPMRDGSVYLCGYSPTGSESKTAESNLLTHLDENGHTINYTITSEISRRYAGGGNSLTACSRWGEGIVAAGLAGSVTRSAIGLPTQRIWVQLFAFDTSGNLLWERDIPLDWVKNPGPDFGPLLVMPDSNVAFTITDNMRSELIIFDFAGNVQARKQLSGRFDIVRPVVANDQIQLIGTLLKEKDTLVAITYNEKLDELDRSTRKSIDYYSRVAWRNPNGSLMIFGSHQDQLAGTFSQIVYLEKNLRIEQRVDLPYNQPPFIDSGSIWAASASQIAGQFVAARSLFVGSEQNRESASHIPPEYTNGAVVDFVQIK